MKQLRRSKRTSLWSSTFAASSGDSTVGTTGAAGANTSHMGQRFCHLSSLLSAIGLSFGKKYVLILTSLCQDTSEGIKNKR